MTAVKKDPDIDKRASVMTRKILSILRSLNDSREGRILYNLVNQILLDQDRNSTDLEKRFHSILESISDYCLQQVPENTELRLRLSLLKKLAEPPFPDICLEALFDDHASSPAEDNDIPQYDNARFTHVVGAMFNRPHPNELVPTPAQRSSAEDKRRPDPDGNAPAHSVFDNDFDWENTPESRIVEQTSSELSQLRSNLLRRMSGTSQQYMEFTELLNTLLADLQSSQSPEQLESLRNLLKRKVNLMIQEHRGISDGISATSGEIEKFEMKCQQLNRELGEAKQMSLTDELTVLPNRRSFLRRLANETGRVQRYGYPLAVAMLDLDLFKEINDTHGHEAGDAVLRCYTDQVLSTFRNYDMVARYGGEEFAVLLPHTDGKGAERALNKVRKRASETSFQTNGNTKALVLPTFSAGIAMYRPGEPPNTLIDRADRAMYQSKRHGRNRVELVNS